MRLLASLTLALITSLPVRGSDREIKVFEMIFLPAVLSIDVGDGVTWSWVEGKHRILSGSSSLDPQSGNLFDVPLDEEHPQFTFIFDTPGKFSFFDELNEENSQPGTITVVPFTVEVEVVDIAFTPEEVTIFEGDAVEWVWIEGVHTVTSGAGAGDPQAGDFFDEPSTAAKPLFTYVFTSSGIYPYFCEPHEFLGMVGTVRVQKRFIRGDLGGDEVADLSDAILILEYLFLEKDIRPCPDAADVNDDGSVDISDTVLLIHHLFLTEPSLPAPHPRAGPDRTPDSLECW